MRKRTLLGFKELYEGKIEQNQQLDRWEQNREQEDYDPNSPLPGSKQFANSPKEAAFVMMPQLFNLDNGKQHRWRKQR
ncbi:MAG: hypothetical protein MUD03_07075 [Pirellula sp.]|nr:hypothetical protein [Pirellula sp.]